MKIKFEEAYSNYLNYVKLKKKEDTYLTLERRFKKHILSFFDNYYLNDIDFKKYIEWQNYIEDQNFKYNYKSSLHYTFTDFYKYCNKIYNIENIAIKVGNFRNDTVEENNIMWTISDYNKFMATIKDKTYHLLFTILFYTGIRKGELLALKWDDINFDNNTIRINKTITRTHKIQTPKTKTSNRIINIDLKTMDELKEYKNICKTNLLFENITFSSLLRKKNYYCDLARVQRIRIHDFRHLHAIILFQNDVPIDEISRRLGHSKISITTDTYLKYLPVHEKRVISTLNSLHI